jgi:hypothetical protein
VVKAIDRLTPELDRTDISFFWRVFDNDLNMYPIDYMIRWNEVKLQEVILDYSYDNEEGSDRD